MFESLTTRLEGVFERLRGKGRLSENDVTEAMREVRQALLEADVSFKVVKQFVAQVQERAIGSEVLESLSPAQQVIKIVHEQLIEMLGGTDGKNKLNYAGTPPTVIMLVGLQGSGKTTTVAKLANFLRKQGQQPLMVAADMQRPAAVLQLQQLGKQLTLPVYSEEAGSKPPDICTRAIAYAREHGHTTAILDTAGRLHVDEDLMREVATIRERTHPHEVLLIADAMTGQDAVRVAEAFHKDVGLTGLIMTKMDGDARGGASLSIRAVTGVPIKFMATGEKADALEAFYPERLASRILGMGDVLTLIERAQEHVDQQQDEKLGRKLLTASYDFDDLLQQMHQISKMGPLTQILEMVPGLNKLVGTPEISEALQDGKQMKKVEGMIHSMTPQERQHPEIINGSRKRRIAKGSGHTVQDVNQLLKTLEEMRQMMKQMAAMQKGGKGRRFNPLAGGRGLPFGL
jgi:signal recognition particle subunit SRP54